MNGFPDDEIWEIIVNDRLGRRVRVKCSPNDSIGDFKALVAMQIGTDKEKIRLMIWYSEIRDILGLTVGDVLGRGGDGDGARVERA